MQSEFENNVTAKIGIEKQYNNIKCIAKNDAAINTSG